MNAQELEKFIQTYLKATAEKNSKSREKSLGELTFEALEDIEKVPLSIKFLSAEVVASFRDCFNDMVHICCIRAYLEISQLEQFKLPIEWIEDSEQNCLSDLISKKEKFDSLTDCGAMQLIFTPTFLQEKELFVVNEAIIKKMVKEDADGRIRIQFYNAITRLNGVGKFYFF